MKKGKRLFLVSGFRGAGKSTLLALALSKRLAIFGIDLDPFFQKTKFPCKPSEHEMTLEEALECGSWITFNHIAPLNKLIQQPENITIHLDYVSFLLQSKFCLGRTPAEVGLHFSQKNNAYEFIDSLFIFLDNFLLRNYEAIFFNTLFTPWEVIRTRLVDRNYPDSSFSYFISRSNSIGEKMHYHFYKAWSQKINSYKPNINLVTEFRESEISITDVTGAL